MNSFRIWELDMDDWLYRIGLVLCLCLVISVGSIIYFVWKDRLYKKSK